MAGTNYQFTSSGADKVVSDVTSIGDASQSAASKVQGLHQAGVDASSGGLAALSAASNSIQDKMQELAGSTGSLGEILMAIGPAGLAAAAAIGGIYEAGKDLVTTFADAELAMTRVQAVLTATGNSSGVTADQIEDMANTISVSTLASKDDVLQAAAVLATFGGAAGDNFEAAMNAAVDLSAVMGGDLTSAAQKLGRVLEDPAANLDALRRVGIQFTDDQKAQIQAFQDTGDHAAAVAAILADITAKVGGVGAAEGNTLTGAFHALTQSYDQFLEQISQSAPIQALMTLLSYLAKEAQGAAEAMTPLGKLQIQLQQAEQQEAQLETAANMQKQAGQGVPDYVTQEIQDAQANVKAIQDQITALQNLKTADQQSAAAAADHAATTASATAVMTSSNADLAASMLSGAQAMTQEMQADQAAYAQREQTIQSLQIQDDASARLLQAYQLGFDAFQETKNDLQVEAELRQNATNAATQQGAAIVDLVRSRQDEDAQLKQLQDDAAADAKADQVIQQQNLAAIQQQQTAAQQAVDRLQKAVVQLSQQASDQIVAAFVNMATGAQNPFDQLKNYALKTFEQIAAAAVITPIIQPVLLSALGSVAGVSSGTGATGSSGISGSGGAQLVSLGGGLYSLAGGSSGVYGNLGASVAGSINNFGASLGLGLSPGSISVGSQTFASDAGDIVTPGMNVGVGGTTLSGILGAGGLGALGGGIFASLIGGNQTYGSIGGGLGAAIGTAILPGIGSVIGGLIGALASLFGPGPSNMTEGYQFNPLTGSSTQVGNAPGSAKFSQQNLTNAGSFQTAIEQFVTGITSAVPGSQYVGGNVGFDTGTTQGSNVYLYNPANSLAGTQLSGGSANFSDPTAALSATIQALTTQFNGLPADVETAFKNIDWTGDLSTNLSLVTFAANFQSNIKAMEDGTLNIQQDAYTAATTQVQSYITQIQTFKDTTSQLGLSTDDANTATQDFVKQLIGLQQVTAPDALQAQIETLKGTFAAIGPLLQEVGLDASLATTQLQASIATLTSNELASLTSQDNSVLGLTYLNDISTAISSYSTNISDLQALGTSTQPALKLFDDTITSIITKAVAAAPDLASAQAIIENILQNFSDMPDVVTAANLELAQLPTIFSATATSAAQSSAAIADVNKLYSQQTTLINGQITTLNSSISAWQSASDTLATFAQSLPLDSSLSPLGLGDQVNLAQQQMQAAFTAAMGGDSTAAANFPDLAKQFLSLDQQFNASNATYASDFAMVQNMTTQLQGFAGAQVSVGQQQLTVLQQILTALTNGQAAVANGGASPTYTAADGQALTQAYGAALAASGMSQADFLTSSQGSVWIQARDDLISGTTDPTALATDFANAQTQMTQPGMSSIGGTYLQSVVTQMNKLGIPVPQFALGGIVTKPTLAVVGEGTGPEAIIPLKNGSVPVNMTGLSAQIASGFDGLANTVAASGTMQLKSLSVIATNTASTAQSYRRGVTLAATSARQRMLKPRAA